jgi:hypothetical protein
MASETLNISGTVAVEPDPSSNIAIQSLSPVGDEATQPSSQVAMANEALDTNGAIAVEPSSLAAEPDPLSNEGPHQAVSHATMPDKTVTTTETTIPVTNKGRKRKGHRQVPTATDTTGQGTRVMKREAASREEAIGELPPKTTDATGQCARVIKRKAALPREGLTKELPPKKRKTEETPTVRTSSR